MKRKRQPVPRQSPSRRHRSRAQPPSATGASAVELHPELLTADLPAAARFYRGLCGWRFEALPMPPGEAYLRVSPGTGPVAGMLQIPPDRPPHWALFITVPDLRRTVARAKKLGATVLRSRCEVAGYGVYATLKDPTGAEVHLWQSLKSRRR